MASAKPIGIGLVGIGRAGWGMHCKELEGREAKFQIVAACDLLPERREQMAEKYACSTYERIEDLIADPQVELVDIASRSCDHLAHAKLALAAGRDVFLEKPICLTYQDALELKAAAEASTGRLHIRHNRRFEPGFQHIRELIASGLLGDVYEIKLRRGGYQRRDDWQTIKSFGGGQLLNWGPHIIDHGLQFLESPLKNVWADLKLVAAVGDAEDHLKIILKGENGRIVDLEISGGAALSEPEYIVCGTRGMLTCDGKNITLKYLDPQVALESREPDPGTPGTGFGSKEQLQWIEKTLVISPEQPTEMEMIWDHLYAALREGVAFPVKLEEAVQVMYVVSEAKKGTQFA